MMESRQGDMKLIRGIPSASDFDYVIMWERNRTGRDRGLGRVRLNYILKNPSISHGNVLTN